MKDENAVSSFSAFLQEMRPMVTTYYGDSVLMRELSIVAAERKAKDDAYLASLSEAERRRVLVQRRIADVEARYRAWWEHNMAWRFRADPPECGCDGW